MHLINCFSPLHDFTVSIQTDMYTIKGTVIRSFSIQNHVYISSYRRVFIHRMKHLLSSKIDSNSVHIFY